MYMECEFDAKSFKIVHIVIYNIIAFYFNIP